MMLRVSMVLQVTGSLPRDLKCGSIDLRLRHGRHRGICLCGKNKRKILQKEECLKKLKLETGYVLA